jgi:aminoglycoside 3-N-acetyltransferase I
LVVSLGVKGCLRDDVGITTGVPQIADDLLPCPSRLSRANCCRECSSEARSEVLFAHARSSRYSYQQITSADVVCLKDLLRVFGEAFDDVATYQRAVPSDEHLARLLTKPNFIAVAAKAGGEVVGGLAAYVLDKFEQDRREIYIYDLAVAEGHRRRRIATGLINELRNIAAERDVYVIVVQADLVDGPAIALYASVGTKETAHHFDIEVRCR